MTAATPPGTPNGRKPRFFFIVGFSFLFLMALFSSVDASIVYILLGISGFFFFLAIYNVQWLQRPFDQRKRESFSTSSKASPAFTGLRQAFNQWRIKVDSSKPASRKTIMIIALAIVGFVVILPILIAISSGDNSYDSGYYNAIAEQHFATGQYDSATYYYRMALQADPDSQEALIGYGKVLSTLNQNDSAIYYFDRTLSLNDANATAIYNKAWVYYQQQKYTEGTEMLASLMEDNSDYYDAMLLLGDFYYVQKEYDKAIPWYEKAYQDGGARSRMLCHIMAYIYDTEKNYDKAIPLYKEALSYDSMVVEIYDRLGELLPGQEGNVYRAKRAALK